MKDFMELARKRFSVRSFKSRPVEKEKIELILRAAQLAPTAVNYQPQMIYLLKSDDALQKIRLLTRSTYDAPMVFLICADEDRAWKSRMEPGYSTAEMDASIVATHMMLEAWELGVGSVWVRLFDSRQVAAAFKLPSNIKPICLLPIGYAADDCVPYAPWHDVYRPIEEFFAEL